MSIEKYQKLHLTTIKDVGECLAVIKELHPGWKFDVNLTPKLWHDALKHYPVNIVKRTVLDLAQNNQYVPKLAEVLEVIKGKDNQMLAIGNNHSDPLLKQADEWWVSLNEEEKLYSHQRQLDFIKGVEIDLSENEKYRADLLKYILENEMEQ